MLPSFAPVVQFWRCQPDYLAQNNFLITLAARCSQFIISKVLAARMRKLITVRARKNKRTSRMLANASKDHSIHLILIQHYTCNTKVIESPGNYEDSVIANLGWKSKYSGFQHKLCIKDVEIMVKWKEVNFDIRFIVHRCNKNSLYKYPRWHRAEFWQNSS